MGDALRSAWRWLGRALWRGVLPLACIAAGPARADAPPPAVFPNTGTFQATLQRVSSNVAVIELAGGYNRDAPNGQLNIEPRGVVAREFYRHHADKYDFIVVFSKFEFNSGDAKAFYIGVRNDTLGLGMAPYDNSAYFGSNAKLQGYIDMAALGRYQLNPNDSRFEETMRVLSHELLHRWAASVRFMDGNGQPSTALLGRDGAHWSFLLDTGGSVEYGNRWVDNGNGSFTSQPDRQFFSPLDLYLMGMLRRQEVPPFFYIHNPDESATRLPEAGVTITGQRRNVTIDQVIAAEGARQPDADASQKQFRIGFVLLTEPGSPATDDELRQVNAVREAFETRLVALTGGRATAHAFLEARPAVLGSDPSITDPVLRPGNTANMQTATQWLRARQQAAGDWSDSQLTRVRDTVVATRALSDTGNPDPAATERAVTWLGTQVTSNIDYAARRVSALGGRATEADWAQLAAAQNTDGGWGAAPGYQSSPLDTALVVQALAGDPNTARRTAASTAARAFLISKQNADGGWSHAVNGVSRTFTTAQAMRALATLGAGPQVAAAARFLATRQNIDGGFGDSPSTTHDTSNVLLALSAAGQLGAIRTLDGFGFLGATQQPDGSWDGSVYATGLAIHTLGTAQTYNWAVSSIVATPASVTEGYLVAVDVPVANVSTVAAPATTVALYLGDTTGTPVAQVPVPALQPGASITVRGMVPTLNRTGNHTITALVDPASLGVEMSRADNQATTGLLVGSAPVQPDLVIFAPDVQAMPSVVSWLPTSVAVVSRVTNLGTTDVLGARVRLLAGATLESLAVVDERTVNVMGRATVPVTSTLNMTQPGRRVLVVEVQMPDGQSEIRTDNNRAQTQIETTSSFDPAVVSSGLSVTPAQQAMLGVEASLRAVVRNHGTSDTPPFDVVLSIAHGSTVREIGRLTVQLVAGGDRSIVLPWTPDVTGPVQFRVQLDPANVVSDMDRTNNAASLGFTVVDPATQMADLTVVPGSVTVTPVQLNRLPTTGSVSAQLTNLGAVPATAVRASLLMGTSVENMVVVGSRTVDLAPGANVPVEIPFSVTTPGRYLFSVYVDPDAAVPDRDRANNRTNVVMEMANVVDVGVSAGEVGVPQVPAMYGTNVDFSATVRNHGTIEAANFNVVFHVVSGSVRREVGRSLITVPPGGSSLVPASWTVDLTGALQLEVSLDPTGTLPDTNQTNNVVQVAFSGGPPAPNLRIEIPGLAISPSPALQGRPLDLSVVVRNGGQLPASNVQVGFYDGDPASGGTLLAPLQTIPALAAGASAPVSVQVPNLAISGAHVLYAVVDPANLIAEHLETDNAASLATIVSTRPDLAVTAETMSLSPSAPRPGDSLTVLVGVSNFGQQPAEQVLVRLLDGDTVVAEQTIPSIAGLGQSSASFRYTLPTAQVARSLTVVVDPANTIAEGDETNNQAVRRLNVHTGAAYVSETYFSPNGDGVKDSTSFSFRLDTPAQVRVVAVDESDQVVRHFAGIGTVAVGDGTVTWDGRDDIGRIVPDGVYRLRASSTSGGLLAEADTVVDNNRTPVLRASGTPAEYYRNLSCTLPYFDTWTSTLDEQSLFFLGNDFGRAGIFRASLAGEATTTVLGNAEASSGGGRLALVSASARGEVLAYGRINPQDAGDGWLPNEIWTIQGDGTARTRIASAASSMFGRDLRRVDELSLAHDGRSVAALVRWSDCSTSSPCGVIRLPVGQGGSPQQLFQAPRIDGWAVAPNRRKAVLRVYNASTDRFDMVVVDFESGAFTPMPAGLYPNGVAGSTIVKWSPDSSRFLVYGTLEDMGVDANNKIDFEFDVFDASFNLDQRFRTDKGPGDNAWYSGEVSSVEWSSAGDEFVFMHEPRPNGRGWYGGGVEEADYASTPSMYRANLAQRSLTQVPMDWQLLTNFRSGPLLWAPNSRSLVKNDPDYNDRHVSVHADRGQMTSLFPGWRSQASNPQQVPMSLSNFAPSGRRLYFSSDRDRLDASSACYAPQSGLQLFAYESLHNLVADFQPLQDPRAGGISLRGTAADLNFGRYLLHYADVRTPNEWNDVSLPVNEERIGEVLGLWVPPGPGTYLVRLTVEDRAGNSAATVRRVTWTETSPVSGVIKNFDYISPNGDGVQDALRLTYRVNVAGSLSLEVRREDDTRVRLITINHPVPVASAAAEWDGRDDQGRVVPDGRYRVRLLDYEVQVEVDTTPPHIEMTGGSEHAFNFKVLPVPTVMEFFGDALKGTVSPLQFRVLPQEQVVATIRDASDILIRELPFDAGTHDFVWDGRDKDGLPMPAGTYQLTFASTRATDLDGRQFPRFTLEFRRGQTGLSSTTSVLYHMVDENGDGLIDLAPLFAGKVSDRLLQEDEVTIEYGWGQPPAAWNIASKGTHKQSMPSGLSIDDVKIQEDSNGVPTATYSGHHGSRGLSGLHIRASARDKAGNTASATVSYRDFQEVVQTGEQARWIDYRSRQMDDKGIVSTTTFNPRITTVRSCPASPRGFCTMQSADLAFSDSLRGTIVSTDFRYFFVREIEGQGPFGPLKPYPIVLPLPETYGSLNWTTVSLRDANGAIAAQGFTDMRLDPHGLAFHWTPPRQEAGYWLYQLVVRDDNGQEVRSSVHAMARTSDSKLADATWKAWHEPALECGATPTEVAHVEVKITYPGEEESEAPRPSGKRLLHLNADGSTTVVYEDLVPGSGGDLGFNASFSTASWPIGRHDFVAEIRPAGQTQWVKVASPYLYVNHAAPQVLVETLPRMCAAREAVVNVGTLPYVPLNIEIREPYAAYHDAQLQGTDLSWKIRGPIGVPTDAEDLPAGVNVQATKQPNTTGGVTPVYCSLPGGCADSGPIVWPRRQGNFRHASDVRLYGAEPDGPTGVKTIPFSGDLTARVRAYGSSGHLSCAPVRLNVDGSVEATAGIDRTLFSPNGDGVLDTASAVLTAFEDVTARVDVVPATRRLDGIIQVDGEPIAELANNLALSAGSGDRLVPWDGRTSAGIVAPDRGYALRVTFTDTCGNVRVELLFTEVDTTPPAIVVTEPRPNTEAPLDLVVRGSVNDLHPGHYEVDGVAGSVPVSLPPIGSMNRAQVDLAQWNTAGLTGVGRIVVRAVDAVGNRSELQVPLTLNGAVNLVASLRALPDPFSPNGDGRREAVTLQYTLSNAANVSVVVQRESTGAVVATLAAAQARPVGDGSLVWNGRGIGGLVEPDGRYVAVLTAEVVSNGNVVSHQTVRAVFQLDATPPAIGYTLPVGPVTTGAGGVVARATDPLLTHAALEVSIAGGAFTAMAETHAGTGELAAPLDGVPEGPVRLRVQAEDLAENRSASLLDVIIDRTPPLPRITSPPVNAYVSGLKGLYSLDGSIEELNPASWQLRLGSTVLREGTTLPTPGRLLHWNPLSVADGPYTLTLQALDLAGLSGAANVSFTVDNTPPVAQIHATGSPVYLKLGSVLRGTATDVNFEHYRVEIAPGNGSSGRWSEVGRGNAEVRDAPLTTLSVLPADGVYALRLTSLDKAGNETSTTQDVVVDTLAPQSVTLTAELRNRRDADVRWVVASEPDAAGYILFRNGSRLNTALLTTTTYLDAGLPGGTYVYTVKVVDRAGNESDPSNEGRVVVTTSEPVAQIFAPTQNAYAAGLMDVRGTASAPADFREYRLFIGTGAAPTSWELLRRSPVAITANTLSAWNTLNLVEGSLYTLRLEAEDLSGVIATDRVTVRVKNTPPRAPIQLQGTLIGDDIPLTWTPNTEPDLQGYLLYRNQRLVNANGLVIGSLVPYLIRPAAYNDLNLPDGLYRYVVYAMDMAGNISPPSNEVEFLVDNQPPHVPVVRPIHESTVGESVTLVGESPDTDIATVQFQFKPATSQVWVNVGAPQTANAGPWRVEWITTGLSHGTYHVRAVATDLGGKVDPLPGQITLFLSDLRKPDPATTLTARVTGGDVALSWVSSASTYAVGYHVDRVNPDATVTRLTTAPLAGLTYTDPNRPDAAYTYRVYAVSAGNTLADPSNDAPAVVFTPSFTQPYTPTIDAATVLEGETRPAHRVMLRNGTGTQLAEVQSAADGRYRFEAIALAQGDNRFVIVAGDAQGNTSKPAPWHARRGNAPAAPTGLSASVTGHDVALTWAANTETDLEGYVPALAGVLRAAPAQPLGASASSIYPAWGDYYAAYRAIDTDAYSGWRPTYEQPAAGQWLEVQLGEQRNVESVSLLWADGAAPLRYRIEGYDGEVWVPLAQVQATHTEAEIDVRLARSYRTDRLRVLVLQAHQENVQLNSLALTALARTPLRSASFPGLPDGHPRTGVVAVTSLGFVGPVAEATPAVGDVTPPDAPVLQAQAVLSDAHLSWVGPSNLDVAGFRLWRDGQLIATLMNPAARSHVDPSLPNAHYDYRVAAIDTAGNVGLPSNIAGVDINVGGPSAPITAAATAPAGGGLVVVSWTVAAGPQPSSFLLARATTPGGPYATIATRVPASPYDDTAVQNGVRYYYRVTGLDPAGNNGNTSNEADALPLDRQPPGLPYFVLPSRAPGPVVTEQARSTLVGLADPGSQVVITRDGERVGAALAAAQAETQVVQEGQGNTFDMTPDGSLLYFYRSPGAVRRDDGSLVPAVSLSMQGIQGFRFAPDGRSAAVLRQNDNTGLLLLLRWNRATDTVSPVSSIVQPGLLAFSPDGRTLAARAYEVETSRLGVVLIDWTNGSTRFIEGAFEHGAWSPDSRTLALATSTSLRLVNPVASSDVTVPAVQFPGSVSWVHDGSALLVDAGDANGDRVISRVAIPSLAVSVIAAEPGVTFSRPVASPDSDAYLALRNGVLVKRGPAGQLEVVATEVLDYHAPVWAGSHTIVYQSSWASFVVRKPAGRFVLPDADLAAGSNFFGAVAVDAVGNSSPPAAELEIRRLVPDMPDWSVTEDSWTVLPTTPQTGEATSVAVRVRNLGAAAPSTRVTVSVADPQGNVLPVFQATLPAMAAGAEQVLRGIWTSGLPGRYTFMAVVDPAGLVQERSKDNNQAAFELFVSGANSGGPELQVRTDKLRYTGGETVAAEVAALSNGAAFDGSLLTRIVDANGVEVTRFEARPVQGLRYGHPQTFAYTWPSGTSFSGDYRVAAQLVDAQGQPAAQASAGFAIEPATIFGAAITTDRAQYLPGETVNVRGTVRYQSGNAPVVSTSATLSVRSAGGEVIATRAFPLQGLLQGSQADVDMTWTAGAVGPYTANLVVGDTTPPSASAEAAFAVVPPGSPLITGRLQVAGDVFATTEPINTNSSVANQGAPIDPLPVRVRALDVAGQELAVWAGQLSGLGATPIVTPALLNGTWPLATFELRLEAQVAGQWITLDRARVRAAERTPPQVQFTTPLPGAIVRSTATVTARATPRQAPVASVEMLPGAGAWVRMAPQGGDGNGLYFSNALPSQDGPVRLQARATDTLANESSPASLDIVIDNTPPLIVVTGVVDQQVSPTPLTPVISVTDLHLQGYAITLDGVPFVSGTAVGTGVHVLAIDAVDRADNRSSTTLQFTIRPAVRLSGTLTVPAVVMVGDNAALDYTVQNIGDVAVNQLPLTVRVTEQGTGALRVAYPLTTTLEMGQAQAGTVNWTAAAPTGLLTVTLSATVDGVETLLAQAPLRVDAPVEPVSLSATARVAADARVLVFIACRVFGVDDPACLQQRIAAITTQLHLRGTPYRVVTTEADFVAEMRCGTYNAFWVSGAIHLMAYDTLREVREAARRGDGVFLDGEQGWDGEELRMVTGTYKYDWLEEENMTAEVLPNVGYQAGPLATLGRPARMILGGGELLATFNQYWVAAARHRFDLGGTTMMAFEFAGMLAAPGGSADTRLQALLDGTVNHMAFAPTLLTIGDAVRLSTEVRNTGTQAVDVEARATLPEGAALMDAEPVATQVIAAGPGTPAQVVWQFRLEPGAVIDLRVRLRLDTEAPASLEMPVAVYSRPASGAPELRTTATHSVPVAQGLALNLAAHSLVFGLAPTDAYEQETLSYGRSAAETALLSFQEGHYQMALFKWLAVAQRVAELTSEDPIKLAAARQAVALAVEAATDRLCRP